MASIPIILLTALVAAGFYTLVGLAVARWMWSGWSPASGVAPALGWAVFTAISFPVQNLCGFNRASTIGLAAVALIGAVFFLMRNPGAKAADSKRVLPLWAFAFAALIALIPLAGLLPKVVGDGVIIGPTAFDHSKIAMVDEITRLGLPVGNPFFAPLGARGSLSYYYLWHFSAAQVSILSGISGWEADAAMTGFTAYASLILMMGLANRLGGSIPESGDKGVRWRAHLAAAWVGLLCLAGSLRPLITLLFGHRLDGVLTNYYSLEGWVSQASWVPQHLASACCVVLAVLVMADLSQKLSLRGILLLGAIAAAGFGSSTWVGGVTFALAGGVVGLVLLVCAKGRQRIWFAAGAAGAALIAILIAFPLLQAEFGSVANRGGAAPIGFHPYEIFGDWAPRKLRRILDLPGFWLVLLPLDLAAIYPAGVVAMLLYARKCVRTRILDRHALALVVLTFASLGVAWLLVSTIGNNDLGWRAILPAVLILTPFAASGLARWIETRRMAAALPAVALFAAGVPDRLVFANIKGRPTENAPDFAAAPALWSAVRLYAGPNDRVANNSLAQDDLTDWPVNPSWAMLSNRPSCYSGWETARAYVDLPLKRITAIDAQFIRVFNGSGSSEDVRQLAQDYGCKVVALTDNDDAWTKDPFTHSPYYRLAEERPDEWRIYVATTPSATPR